MRRSSIPIAMAVIGVSSTVGYLALAGNNSMDHATHSGHEATPKVEMILPSEAGQSAFAAIAEIVELLSSNPETDWSKINITRLREHLVDMEMLTTEAAATHSKKGDTITYIVRGTGRALSAVQSMVPAHAEQLNKTTSWKVKTQAMEDGIQMSISTKSKADQSKLMALGFFGVMSIGAHHQSHHLAMSKGEQHGH